MTHNSNSQTWNRAKLKDLCDEITVGHVGPMAQEYVSEGITFLRSQNILPFHLDLSNVKYITPAFHHRLRKSALKPGDVVVVRTGYPGTACVVPETLRESNCADLVIFRPSKVLDSWFLVALLNSATGRSQIAGALVGVAQQHFNVSAAKDLFVRIPPLPTQRKIADILSAYDDLIENNTRRIQILEEMAQTIYREWFINFRFPGHENVEMVESEFGMIPEGWETRSVFDLADVTYGYPFSAMQFSDNGNGMPVIRIRDIRNNLTRTFTLEEAPGKYLVEDGDILVGMDGDFHMGRWAGGQAYLNQRVARIRPKATISPYFLFWALKKPIEFFDSTITGTTVAHLGDAHLRTVRIVFPAERIARMVAEVYQPLFDLDISLHKRNFNLRQTRDLLLPKLVSGELVLSDCDQIAREDPSESPDV